MSAIRPATIIVLEGAGAKCVALTIEGSKMPLLPPPPIGSIFFRGNEFSSARMVSVPETRSKFLLNLQSNVPDCCFDLLFSLPPVHVH